MAFGTLVVGGALNALPILLNGAMPYRASARELGDGLKGTPIDDDTMLPMLGDVIELPAGKLVSLGDLVLAVGATLDRVPRDAGLAAARGVRSRDDRAAR